MTRKILIFFSHLIMVWTISFFETNVILSSLVWHGHQIGLRWLPALIFIKYMNLVLSVFISLTLIFILWEVKNNTQLSGLLWKFKKRKKQLGIWEISPSVWFRVGIQLMLSSFLFQWANNVQIDPFLFLCLN